MRFMGVVATGALLAIFVTAVITFMPERGEKTVVSAAPAATATPAPSRSLRLLRERRLRQQHHHEPATQSFEK